MKTLKDTIHQITLPTPYAVGDVHVYILKGDLLSLVDAGVKTKEAWEELQKQLDELGYSPLDIQQVILTHHHPDHMGLVENFPNVKTVAAHPKLRPWLERDEEFFVKYEAFFQQMYKEAGVPESYYRLLKSLRKPLQWSSAGRLTYELTEGTVIPGHEEWVTIETPGHAQSHISFYREADGAFLGGDHLLEHISSNPLLEPPYYSEAERPRPLLQYRDSMMKLLDNSVETVYPGHGKIFYRPDALIRDRLKKQEKRAEKVLQMIASGATSPYEVCKQLFPKHIENQFGLTMSETYGQLDYLEYKNLVKYDLIDERKYYYVNR